MDGSERRSFRKFKLFNSYPDGPGGAYVFDTFFSPDGIHWSARQPGQPPALSDRSTVFYNPYRNVWVASDRGMPGSLPGTATVPTRTVQRARYYAESPDLNTWTPSNPYNEFWQAADERDPVYPGTSTYPELYNLDATPYESLMVGLFSFYIRLASERPRCSSWHGCSSSCRKLLGRRSPFVDHS